MFTGIIKEIGIVKNILKKSGKTELKIECNAIVRGIELGSSVAINGACLTVTQFDKSSFRVDVVEETMKRTSFSQLKVNDRVNLEPSLVLTDRLEGHIVQGHVDCVGKIRGREIRGESILLTIKIPEKMESYIVEKGSICIDGISLTIASIANNYVTIALIPFSLENTTLKEKKTGEQVNIEFDIIGKYVNQIMEKKDKKIDKDFLKKTGFM